MTGKKKEISFQMEHKFNQMALARMVSEGELTYGEVCVYNIIRSHAFLKKNTKKRICKITHQYVAEILNLHPNIVHKRVRALERIGMLKPIFKIKYGGQVFDAYNFEEAKKDYGLRSIMYKNYEIKKSKIELFLEKEYLNNNRVTAKTLYKTID